jgi:hypothetical protein
LLVLATGSAAVGLWLYWWNHSLVNPIAPSGLYDLELAGSAERARVILDSWRESPNFRDFSTRPADAIQPHSSQKLQRVETMLMGGLLFIPLWTLTLACACAWLADAAPRPGLGTVAAWSALLAGLADAIENTLLLRALQELASLEAAARAFPAAIVKFALLGYVFAWLIWALRSTGRPRLALAAAISAIVLMAPIALSIFR